MKKKELSPSELNKVVELRQLGANWTEIQDEIGVDRRIIKRVYEEWERDKKMKQQEAVRFRVAAEAFHEHLDFIITLASYLIDNLGLSDSPIETNSEQFFSALWQENILRRWGNTLTNYPRLVMDEDKRRFYNMKRIKENVQENEQIFESLQVHTKELRWEALDEWESARDQCIEILGKLRGKSNELIGNYINEKGLLDKLKEASTEQNSIEGMVEAVVQAIWIKDEEKYPLIEAVSVEVKQTSATALKVPQLPYQGPTFLTFTENSLADKVAEVCNQVVIDLCEAEEVYTVSELHYQISIMKEATEELAEMLSPLKLRPIILRTRCELCPA